MVERQITHRGIESLKNGEPRHVDFNPRLKAHLEDMVRRKAPDTDWMFPSPQRGEKDICAHDFKESFNMARRHAVKKHPSLVIKGFHDLRHSFISYAVMSGVDFMTIASWVGHRDGGVLIGKVYGHLADEHKKAMASRLSFGPALMEESATQCGQTQTMESWVFSAPAGYELNELNSPAPISAKVCKGFNAIV
jgi:integrase